jgi:SRSO17 transposase
MKGSRTMADLAREAQVAEQNMQHFMSNSPWSGRALIEHVQQAIVERPELQGGLLILDESADEKSGDRSAGAGRQHNGRMGKVDECQVGVYLAYAKEQHWTLWDGCLFILSSGSVPVPPSDGPKSAFPASGPFKPRSN